MDIDSTVYKYLTCVHRSVLKRNATVSVVLPGSNRACLVGAMTPTFLIWNNACDLLYCSHSPLAFGIPGASLKHLTASIEFFF